MGKELELSQQYGVEEEPNMRERNTVKKRNAIEKEVGRNQEL